MTNITYRNDFYAWTQEQAALLKEEEFTEVDWQNLIEEIESMGRSEQKELESRLSLIIMHLLKMQYQPQRRGRSWATTIAIQCIDLRRHLRKNPSLRAQLAEAIADIYPDAVQKAAIETRLPSSIFPIDCPWTVEEILDKDWLPG